MSIFFRNFFCTNKHKPCCVQISLNCLKINLKGGQEEGKDNLIKQKVGFIYQMFLKIFLVINLTLRVLF